MVRQLVYDFRSWKSLEAVGRLGADEGIDIRGIELLSYVQADFLEEDLEEADLSWVAGTEERTWLFQCKRERRIGPTRVAKIAREDLGQQPTVPYGYVIAAACDFSKASRDAFRGVMVEFGVQEFHLWGKAELEDMLFLPKNDHLLFAYFGISLQVRRRNIKTEVRAKLALKRQLVRAIGPLLQHRYEPVLIRDPRDEDYPDPDKVPKFLDAPQWRYWEPTGHNPLYHVSFVGRKCFAYVNWATGEWDALFDYDDGWPITPGLWGVPLRDYWEHIAGKRSRYHSFWYEKLPAENRAIYYELWCISYDRIVAVDDLGDGFNKGPHLLVEYRDGDDPFETYTMCYLQGAGGFSSETRDALEETHIRFFPDEIPETDTPG
jgi:hypothetical protein